MTSIISYRLQFYDDDFRNYAVYKSKLKKELDTALATGREEEVEKLSTKLNQLEERAEELDRKRSSKISSIALINDKNRKKNIERAEEGIRLEMERIKKEGVVSKVLIFFYIHSLPADSTFLRAFTQKN